MGAVFKTMYGSKLLQILESQDCLHHTVIKWLDDTLRPLFSVRNEPTIVSLVNEDPPTQFSITFDNAPTPAAGVIAIIVSLPRELDQGHPITLREMAVDKSYNCNKLEASEAIVVEGDIRGAE